MGLNITQFNGKWRICITEEWEFKTKQDFERCLKRLIDYKGTHGQIKPKRK